MNSALQKRLRRERGQRGNDQGGRGGCLAQGRKNASMREKEEGGERTKKKCWREKRKGKWKCGEKVRGGNKNGNEII